MKSSRVQLALLWAALLVVAVSLLIWSLQGVPFADLGRVLSALQPRQILLLLLVNIAILLLFPLRWDRILRAQGYRISYLTLARYRLLGFAVSYFSPGQHFGGEPVLVLYLKDRQQVPGSAALASVTLDKVIELFANFAVLALGLAASLSTGMMARLPLAQALPISMALLLLPALYLWAVVGGKQPFGAISRGFSGRTVKGIREAERQLGTLARKQPALLWQGLVIAALVWVAQIFEIWFSVRVLGLSLSAMELTLVVVAGRIALFAPTPGALGALEGSLILAMQSLGYGGAYGLSLSFLIRARDIIFGLVGLLLAGFGDKPALNHR
ncbi:MAG TPA: lysylphosphatidylglycerol synthase transmembrane domain-containing protein [Anaerolineales bacterium]|nr:lysylphosphatidylglycerol synthase transmembrane domain-containing protein [Anaerolineales bacterium]